MSPATELRIGGQYIQPISVAVPLRVRSGASVTKPLAGLRVGVKDIFQIEGIRTSIDNRRYYELYPPAKKTAGCVTFFY